MGTPYGKMGLDDPEERISTAHASSFSLHGVGYRACGLKSPLGLIGMAKGDHGNILSFGQEDQT